MLAKLIRLFVLFILEKIGLVSDREVEADKEQKEDYFWNSNSFWENGPFGEDGPFRKSRTARNADSNTVDGTWREVREDEEDNKTKTESFDSDSSRPEDSDSAQSGSSGPTSLQDNIRIISGAAEGIRHQKIREQTFHVLIIAKDIIYEHDTGHNKCRNYNQFERYYIPTLASVINNYYSMESRGIANSKMKKDVLSYLEGCGDAFTHMYNSMFNEDIMTMEVQMEAMEIILKRDGLL